MFQEQVSNESTKANLELLCDIELIMPKNAILWLQVDKRLKMAWMMGPNQLQMA